MLTTIIGIIGAALILLAFILEQTHVWKDTDLKYDVVNFLGSAILIYYGLKINGYPFVVLNSIWALVSARDIILDLRRKKL